MTELEKLQRARMYMDKLANGADPISGAELPKDSVLNNVRLARCFFYVSDVLRQVIDNGGTGKPAKRPGRPAFQLSDEIVRNVPFSKQPVHISEFVKTINDLADTGNAKRLTAAVITGWLLEKGFLELHEYPGGKRSRLPTKQGEYIGLSTEVRTGQYGEYRSVLYNEDAQHFVLDNLPAMLEAYGNEGSAALKASAANCAVLP